MRLRRSRNQYERTVTVNGEGGARVTIPPQVMKALELLTSDIVLIDIVEEGTLLEKEIRIRKKPVEEPKNTPPF